MAVTTNYIGVWLEDGVRICSAIITKVIVIYSFFVDVIFFYGVNDVNFSLFYVKCS
jgi:hypothetical protein